MNAIKNKLKLTDERSHFKPFNYPWAYDAWIKHEQSHWLHTEVPMLEDVKDWKKKLTPSQKSAAKARAKAAGRPYPNLVDNAAMAKKAKKTKKKGK